MTVRAPARGQRAWLAAAAVHAVYTLRETGLYALVRDLGETADEPLVRETAQWVRRRPLVAG